MIDDDHCFWVKAKSPLTFEFFRHISERFQSRWIFVGKKGGNDTLENLINTSIGNIHIILAVPSEYSESLIKDGFEKIFSKLFILFRVTKRKKSGRCQKKSFQIETEINHIEKLISLLKLRPNKRQIWEQISSSAAIWNSIFL